ncbi:SAM-dependent methyltransferase [Rhodobacter sp. TJ_12]|uniref:SAM-dependent methyltransferase n=1 Tax=Rhodobacter sp. TJ_12 TaxID=2029399 RepID=UPI001CBAD910|nr:class I SAM-dependent methyltransferase [Rhodobacter sp. TJ_12]
MTETTADMAKRARATGRASVSARAQPQPRHGEKDAARLDAPHVERAPGAVASTGCAASRAASGGAGAAGMSLPAAQARTESYYDSLEAETFYAHLWGGEDLHIGIFDGTDDIRTASDNTIAAMLARLPQLGPTAQVLDMGAGYGGAMRMVVGRTGCRATCLNLSRRQNARNLCKIEEAGLQSLITVRHGMFEDVPAPDGQFDVVWSQDAFLHSDRRYAVLREAWRVLRPGGDLIFTDPMQVDGADPSALQAVYDRLNLDSLGSPGFYRATAEAIGFTCLAQDDMTGHLRTTYARVRDALWDHHAMLLTEGASADWLDRMATGLETWVKAADAGQLAWGIQHFRKPKA